MMKQRLAAMAALVALIALAQPSTASAYIGPGAGLSAIGSLFAIVGAVLLAIVGFVWYPVKRMIRGARAKSGKA